MDGNSVKKKNYFHELISTVCSHYSKGEYVKGDGAICDAYFTKEENRIHNAATRMDYFDRTYNNNSQTKTLMKICTAFREYDNFFEGNVKTAKGMENVIRGVLDIAPFLSAEDKDRLRPGLDIVNTRLRQETMRENAEIMKPRILQEDKVKSSNDSLIAILKKEVTQLNKTLKNKDLNIEQTGKIKARRSELAIKLYRELDKANGEPQMSYEVKAKNLTMMIKSVDMFAFTRTEKFKTKERLYKSLSELHFINGSKELGIKARLKEMGFHRAWNNIVTRVAMKRPVRYGER